MLLPEWTNEQGEHFKISPVSTRLFRGQRLPGTVMFKAQSSEGEITHQEWENPLYRIGCRLLRFFKKFGIRVKENYPGIRLEAVLTGELKIISPAGKKTKLLAGQYHLTDTPAFTALFKKDSSCSYFITHYSKELIKEMGFSGQVFPTTPRWMPDGMNDLIHEVLNNPYEEKLRDFYYANAIRELFFVHLTASPATLPGELSDADIAAIYKADLIIATDLQQHYPIPELSQMAGTNEFKLKKGFRQKFNMTVFGRLLYRRMEQAKILLETTSKPIKEVALEAGYETVAGFITAFGKNFGMTPLEWREQKSGERGRINDENQ